MENRLVKNTMPKKLLLFSILSWLIALIIWQVLFNSHEILSPILWEIHTIFSSVIVFYILINVLFTEKIADVIKIVFRILFKVWFVIFFAFSLKKSFNIKGFILTATFVFGYFEGLIDINSWLVNKQNDYLLDYFKAANSKKTRIPVCIIFISIIHVFSALVALVFFNI